MIHNVEICNGHIREVRDLELNSQQLETYIASIPYGGEHLVRDAKVEDSRLPPIALFRFHDGREIEG